MYHAVHTTKEKKCTLNMHIYEKIEEIFRVISFPEYQEAKSATLLSK